MTDVTRHRAGVTCATNNERDFKAAEGSKVVMQSSKKVLAYRTQCDDGVGKMTAGCNLGSTHDNPGLRNVQV
jgi:hypothetical protein